MKSLKIFVVSIVILCFFGCSNETEKSTVNLSPPVKLGSHLPRLIKSQDEQIYMSWVETSDTSSSLLYSQLQGNKWSKPKLISQGSNWFVNWADFPSLMVNTNFKAAHWLEKSDVGTYDYDIHLSLSEGGAKWDSPFVAHQDGIEAEHGFVSMLPMDEERFFVTWLDGRNTKSFGHDHAEMDHSGAMTLRAGVFDSNGNTMNEWELDKMTCDCCQTAAAMTPDGPVVVYRDRSENEIRDIYITRYTDGAWSSPLPIHNDLWNIAGCPVNGPAVATSASQLAIAWYTGSRQVPKVLVAISNDWGRTFETPTILSEGNTLGRVGITSLEDGSFVISKLDIHQERANINLSRINANGDILEKRTIASTSMQRASGFPSISSRNKEIVLAWTQVEPESKVTISSYKFK